jgi:hypothetical protein
VNSNPNDDAALFDRIAERLRFQMGSRNQAVTPNTDMRVDFGMYGEDALDFLEWYNQEFHVDMNNFVFAKHFENEGWLSLLLKQLLLRPRYYIPITVSFLVDVAKTKKWPEMM